MNYNSPYLIVITILILKIVVLDYLTLFNETLSDNIWQILRKINVYTLQILNYNTPLISIDHPLISHLNLQ